MRSYLQTTLQQQNTLEITKRRHVTERLQEKMKNPSCTNKNPMTRGRASNKTRLRTHVLTHKITSHTSNTTLPILNKRNPNLVSTMDLKPHLTNPTNRKERTTKQQMKNTKTLRRTNQTILKLPTKLR